MPRLPALKAALNQKNNQPVFLNTTIVTLL